MDDRNLQNVLTNTLEMTKDHLDLLKTNRYAFLEHLIHAYDSHVPFQNISHTTVSFSERHQPSVEENVKSVYSGIGGRCWTVCSAMHVILKQLGFQPEAIIGSVLVKGLNDHAMNMVRNLKAPGDLYLIDVGFNNASHPPVPLDFETESPVYSFYQQRVRWKKSGDLYTRQDLRKQGFPGFKGEGEQWKDTVSFQLQTFTLEEIEGFIGKAMYGRENSLF